MANFQITGTLHKKFDREAVSEKFSKRDFVLEIQDGQYPQHIKFQLTQDRCDLLDGWHESQEITVHFSPKGREHNGKYFTNLEAWKIVGNVTAQPEPERISAIPNSFGEPPPEQDLPF